MKTRIVNWGQYPEIDADEIEVRSSTQIANAIQSSSPIISRGLGRSYGDASLSPSIMNGLKRNRFLSFNEETGQLVCEAGVSLDEILKTFVPQGWFLPVTPGTKFVTVGGAVASDVHGKNHHVEGSFVRHVDKIRLLLPNGKIVDCTPTSNSDLFRATAGGMGLTGFILEVSFYMKKIETSMIRQVTYRSRDLDSMFKLIDEHQHSTYTVSWMDCLARGATLGRGILYTGEHAKLTDLKSNSDPLALPKKLPLAVPFNLPSFVLNSLTVRSFNAVLYRAHFQKSRESLVDYDTFFYPLDFVHSWNRIYGKAGFLQYQFVLPDATAYDGMVKILNAISENKLGSFLVVFKRCGDPASFAQAGLKRGKPPLFPLSFPMQGYSLALDFAIQPKLFDFLNTVDEMVAAFGGRVYLTKDARLTAAMLRRTYPAVKEFLAIRKKIDPKRKLLSLLSKRLDL